MVGQTTDSIATVVKTGAMDRPAYEPSKLMSSPVQEAEHQALNSLNKQQRKRSFEANYDSVKANGKRCRIQQDTQEGNGRMLCPYYMRNPRNKEIKTSCFGRGFAEIAKLRDHLKNVHHIPEDLQRELNFRSEPFRSLKDKDSKWKLAFHKLFPEIPKDEIPSPRPSFEEPQIDEVTLDFNALGHLLENQFWAEYGTESTVPIVEFMQRFNHAFVDVAKMWLGLSSGSPIGTATSVRHFQAILDDSPQDVGVAPDFAPCPYDESGSSSPTESSCSDICGEQETSQEDEKDFASPTEENIKLDELLSGTQCTENLALTRSPGTPRPSEDMFPERASGSPVTLKKEPHELTLADCSPLPYPPNTFGGPHGDLNTQRCGNIFDFSTFSLLSNTSKFWEAEVDVSDVMDDRTGAYMDGIANIDIFGWSTCDLDSLSDFIDLPSMFT